MNNREELRSILNDVFIAGRIAGRTAVSPEKWSDEIEGAQAAIADFITEQTRLARAEVIEWLEADLKRLDSHNWSLDTLALDTIVGEGKATEYQKTKRDEIVTDRRAAHALYAILNNYMAQLAPKPEKAKSNDH